MKVDYYTPKLLIQATLLFSLRSHNSSSSYQVSPTFTYSEIRTSLLKVTTCWSSTPLRIFCLLHGRLLVNILTDCKIMLTQFASCQIRHVFRETDRDADYIANVGHLVFSSFNVSPCNNYSLTDLPSLLNPTHQVLHSKRKQPNVLFLLLQTPLQCLPFIICFRVHK